MPNATKSISTNFGSFKIQASYVRLAGAIPFIPGVVFFSLAFLFARIVNAPGAHLPKHILTFVTTMSVLMTILFCYGFLMVCATGAELRRIDRRATRSRTPQDSFNWRYLEPLGALLIAMSYLAPSVP